MVPEADHPPQPERPPQSPPGLPPEERSIVLLREAEGMTFREVSEITGLSRDAIRWRLARGLEKLRLALLGRRES